MKLYIFRHGQTDANANEFVQKDGLAFSELNAVGIAQAEKLRDELAQENLAVIYASPMSRALKTAEIVAEPSGSKIVILPELKEHSFGDVEGLSGVEARQKYGQEFESVLDVSNLGNYEVKVPHGESKAESLVRFNEALDFIKEDCMCEEAGVATHGHIMRIFYRDYFGEDIIFPNCGYFVLEV